MDISRDIKDPIDRFMSHIDMNAIIMPNMDTPCWGFISKGKTDLSSRTSFNAGNRIIAVHIFSYETFVGKRERGDIVYSICGNKYCVNPKHLSLGTLRNALGAVYERDGCLYKICPRCKIEFPYDAEHYYIAKQKTVSFISLCKNCAVDTAIERRNKYWVNTLWHECKRGAISRGYEFSITPNDIQYLYDFQKGKCYWTGIDLVPSTISRYPMKPSLDRLDNKLGYTLDNIVLCCLAINIGRNSSDKDVFEKFILLLKDNINVDLWK